MAVWPLGGPFFGLRAGIWPFGAIPQTPNTPHFAKYLTKLVGTIRVTKKITHFDYGDGPGRNYGETAVFTFCLKAENGTEIRFFPTLAKRLIFIGEKGTFSFPQLLPVVARTWLGVKSGVFFGPKNPDSGPKICFFRMGPRFLSKGHL